jgi:hypothetical protein
VAGVRREWGEQEMGGKGRIHSYGCCRKRRLEREREREREREEPEEEDKHYSCLLHFCLCLLILLANKVLTGDGFLSFLSVSLSLCFFFCLGFRRFRVFFGRRVFLMEDDDEGNVGW